MQGGEAKRSVVCLGVAVDAAIFGGFLICEHEDMLDLLLCGGYAARILAAHNVFDALGKLEITFFDYSAVMDNVHRCAGADNSEGTEVYVDLVGDLDYILRAVLTAACILDYRDLAVQRIEVELIIDLHRLACGDMIDYDAVDDGIYVHLFASSSSLMMSAMRINLP